jgi:hypothetical protein
MPPPAKRPLIAITYSQGWETVLVASCLPPIIDADSLPAREMSRYVKKLGKPKTEPIMELLYPYVNDPRATAKMIEKL